MTTILGIQGDGFCVVGCDSRIADIYEGGSVTVSVMGDSTRKIFPNHQYILGAAGDVRAVNILAHTFVPPVPKMNVKGFSIDAFITTEFIPALRTCFELTGYATSEKESSRLAQFDSEILVALNGQIYVIGGDYSWSSDSHGLYAMGTGASYAMGALLATVPIVRTMISARKAILKALSIAARCDPFTGAPYHTMSQDNKTRSRKAN